MCGIAGYLRFDPEPDPAALGAVARDMGRSMAHRGPDDQGVWVSSDGRCALSHRRLSVIDVSSAGHQPMLTPDGRYVLTYNGEIYDYVEHRRRLEALGTAFRTQSDTEVLLHLLAREGESVLERLDGMYALGLYDTHSSRLLLARDPFGEKPLYYTWGPGWFAFASELHALQQVPEFDATVDLGALAGYLCLQYIDAPRTLYRGVRKLEPGHAMSVDARGERRAWRHFDFQPGRHPETGRSTDDWADELESLLLESLGRRLVADVPVGAFLSGGIDSSTIAALATRRLEVPLQTFSIGFEGSEDSEHLVARQIARHLGCDHHERILSPQVVASVGALARTMDEPNGDASCLPVYLLSEFARERVTVAISGDGGDELFGGYGRYSRMLQEASRAAPGWSPGRAYYGTHVLLFSEAEIGELLGVVPRGLRMALAELREEVDWSPHSLLDRLRSTDALHYLPGAVLAKVDRMSMQHALEVRTPFLSRDLARFAERLPPDMLVGDSTKVLLRHLARRYLPGEIVDLPKRGFSPPPRTGWGSGRALHELSLRLDEPGSPLRRLLGADTVSRFTEQQTRRPGGSHPFQLSALTTLEGYLRSHPAQLPTGGDDSSPIPIEDRMEVDAPSSATPILLRSIDDRIQGGHRVRVRVRGSLPLWYPALPSGVQIRTGSPPPSNAPEEGEAGEEPWTEVLANEDASVPMPPDLLDSLDRGRVTALLGTRGGRWFRFDPDPKVLRTARRLHPLRRRLKPLLHGTLPILAVLLGRFELPRPLSGASDDETRGRRRWRRVADRMGLTSALNLVLRAYIQISRRVLEGRTFVIPLNGVERFRHNQGFCWQVRYTHNPTPRDRDCSEEFALYEDGVPLPHPGADKRAIRSLGGGRYGLLNGNVFFSTWDGVDPNEAGRQYYLMRRRRGGSNAFEFLFRDLTPGDLPGAPLDEHPAGPPAPQVESLAHRPAPRKPGPPPERIVMLGIALGPGGTERQLTNTARHLARSGHPIEIVCTDGLAAQNAHYLPGLRTLDIPVRSISALREFADVGEISRDAQVASLVSALPAEIRQPTWALALHLRHERPDFVIGYLDTPNVIAALAALMAGVPRALLSCRSLNPGHFAPPPEWMRDLYRALSRSPRVVLSTNSQAGALDYADWLGLDPSMFSVLPNGLDPASLQLSSPDARERLRRELGVSPGTPSIAAVFRLGAEKRPLFFLDVVSRVRERVKDLVVLHAGRGPMDQEFRRAIRDRGLEGCVRLLGSRNDIPDLLSIADLLLLTSRHEGLPNVLIEAQFLGVPVVSSDSGGAREAFRDGETGLLCSGSSVEEHAVACSRVLGDHDLRARMSRAASTLAREQFQLDLAVEGLLRTLRNP